MRAIDLFAGAGGMTTGARQAGVEVVWAANHSPVAVSVHAANHPDTEHACQDLAQADFTQVCRYEILLASPACQGHSHARGVDRPHHDVTRSTAWAVVAAVEANRPQALIVENVAGFASWRLFPVWCAALEAYGYALTAQVLDAADVGVPQNRERLFVVGHLGEPIKVAPGQAEHVSARSVIDLDSGNWSPVHKPGRAANTLARIAAGRARFGSEPFLAPYYGSGSGTTGRSLDRPLGTVTTRDRWSLIDGDRMRMLTVPEYRAAMGFPADYALDVSRRQAVHLLGNAVPPPLAAHVVGQVAQALEPGCALAA